MDQEANRNAALASWTLPSPNSSPRSPRRTRPTPAIPPVRREQSRAWMSSPPAAPPAAAAGAGSPDSAAAQSPLPTSSPAPLPPLPPIVAQSHSPPSSAPTAALPTPGPSPQTGLDNAEEPAPALSFANGGTVRSYNPNGLANGNGGAQKNVRKSCEAGLQVRRGSVRASGDRKSVV